MRGVFRQWWFLFLLAALAAHLDLFLGPHALVRFHDTFDSEFFHYLGRAGLLREHGLFAWDPILAGGLPAFACQYPPWHPLVLASVLLPGWLVYGLLKVFLCWGAALGTFRLLAGHLGLDRRAALCGALLAGFGLPGWVVSFSFVFLFPLFFMCWLDLLSAPTRTGRLAAGAGLAFLAALSYPVLTLPSFSLLHLALILAFPGRGPRTGPALRSWLALWTGYFLLFLPTFAALFRYLPQAHRVYDPSFPGLFPALAQWGRSLGSALGSQPGLVLMLWGLPYLGRAGMRRAGLFAVVPLLLSTFFGSPFQGLLAHTFLARMDLGHFAGLVPLGCALFAALGVQQAMHPGEEAGAGPGARLLAWWRPGVLAASVLLAAWRWREPGFAWLPPLFGLLGLLLMTDWSARGRRLPALAGPALLGLALAGLGLSGRYETVNPSLFQPFFLHQGNRLDRLAAGVPGGPWRTASTSGNLNALTAGQGLETLGGRSPLFNRRYKDLFREAVAPQLRNPQDRAFFDAYHYTLPVSVRDIRSTASLAQWNVDLLLAMNLKILFSPFDRLDPPPGLAREREAVYRQDMGSALVQGEDAAAPFRSKRLWVYAFNRTLERGYLATRTRVLDRPDQVLAAMAGAGIERLGQEVFFARADLDGPGPGGSGAAKRPEGPAPQEPGNGFSGVRAEGAPGPSVRLVQYGPDRLVFQGHAPAPAHLVVLNNHDPGWTARVDGQPAPVLRANHAFQAVALPEGGPFTVELDFADPLVWWLHLPALVGLACLLHPLPGPLAPFSPGRSPAEGQDLRSSQARTGQEPWTGQEPPGFPGGSRAVLAALAGGAGATALWAVRMGCILDLARPYPDQYFARYFFTVLPASGLLLAAWSGLCWRVLCSADREG